MKRSRVPSEARTRRVRRSNHGKLSALRLSFEPDTALSVPTNLPGITLSNPSNSRRTQLGIAPDPRRQAPSSGVHPYKRSRGLAAIIYLLPIPDRCAAFTLISDFGTSGFVFGGTVGAKYQVGSLVFGVESADAGRVKV